MTMTEGDSTDSEALSMFFNDDFVPHTYLDALFDSTLTNSSSTTSLKRNQQRLKLDSASTLQSLQSKCSNLLAHLDYYQKELTGDLEERIKKLQASSAVISSELNGDDGDSVTRLEYYVENISNTINSLHDDLQTYNKKIENLESAEADQSIMESLSNLKTAKQKILLVLKVFETAKLVATTADLEEELEQDTRIAPTSNKQLQRISIDIETFTKSIYFLEGAIDEELELNENERNQIIKKIDNLISLLPIFKGLPRFHTVYSDFVNRITEKKESAST